MCALEAVSTAAKQDSAEARALHVQQSFPAEGLFEGHTWRVATQPFVLSGQLASQLESLGRVLLQFYRAANLLYRKSYEGRQPEWVARWLDAGKPANIIETQRSAAFRNEIPRVIRPDLLLTDNGLRITELDSVPGGIGLTAWLNRVYVQLGFPVIGGADGMVQGFRSIFGSASRIHIVISEEAGTYRPEMEWLARQIGGEMAVRNSQFTDFRDGDAVYRFFEMFDIANVGSANLLFEWASAKRIRLTPPPKPIFEEKMLFALLWNRNLADYWRQELGDGFLRQLKELVPYTWLVDPAPLPPHAAIPELGISNWHQLESFSQRERDLILKVSGFSPEAWGARGVHLGSDLSQSDWAAALRKALGSFDTSPFVLQRFHKPSLVKTEWFDFKQSTAMPMDGRARLCPYYFVSGEGDSLRSTLGGVLATICPADKKIIHGMTDAVFAPCMPHTGD